MPSSPKIPKEKIVQTALDLLMREGCSAVNIKRIAGELGCSTQPISWQFGGMEGLRAALAEAAAAYADRRLAPMGENAVAAFEGVGEAYVDLAMDEPNLFRFIYMGESGRHVEGGLVSLLGHEGNASVLRGLAQALCITPEQAGSFMSAMVIYTHGLASLIAAGVVREDKPTAHQAVRETGIAFLVSLGVHREKAERLLLGNR